MLLFVVLTVIGTVASRDRGVADTFLAAASADWISCYGSEEIVSCVQSRTDRHLQQVTTDARSQLEDYLKNNTRTSRQLSDKLDEQDQKLQKENQALIEKIKARSEQPNGLVEEISEVLSYALGKFLGVFTTDVAAEPTTELEARGHKKKYLKKQNKHLKIILLIMLFKNKMKMFMQKIQVFIQLKFLGIAVANLLVNVVRLWLELKKKKPHKVVYYENAHHQHHYDHEHVHDEHHPSGHSHYSHHEEDYGGGPWPWSRAYVDNSSGSAAGAASSEHVHSVHPHSTPFHSLKHKPGR